MDVSRDVRSEPLVKAERELVVKNRLGLHARPAMQLVDMANRFRSDITLCRAESQEPPETAADAKSVMAVITLAATQGTRLRLVADGEDAEEAADEISRLF